jgi:membrane-associated phospholipid phosphatase
MRAMLSLATALGNAAFLLPATALVAASLLLAGSRRAALSWAAAIGLCVALTVLAKLLFHACGAALPGLAIRSPSGHTSVSTTFYACAVLTLAAERPLALRLGLALAGAALIAFIAVSRILLHAHTPQEVVAGLMVGLLCVLYYALLGPPGAAPALRWHLPVLALVALSIVAHRHPISMEGPIAHLAERLSLAQRVCPAGGEGEFGDAVRGTFPRS